MESEEVKKHWELRNTAEEFDSIYDDKGGIITRAANRIFRKGMKQRFNLVLRLCGSKGRTLLDIGCGAGRFCIPLGERGVIVNGIDYSNEMIKIAKKYLDNYCKRTGKKLNVTYECSDFIRDFAPKNKFDMVIAIGVMDYIKEPLKFMKKMKSCAKEKALVSFPAKFTPQMPIRKIWLMTKKCPVYFYTKNQVKKLCFDAGITKYRIIDIDAGYLLEARV